MLVKIYFDAKKTNFSDMSEQFFLNHIKLGEICEKSRLVVLSPCFQTPNYLTSCLGKRLLGPREWVRMKKT